MNHKPERLATTCPSCSPDRETVHERLSTGGGQVTVRCTDCGHVQKIATETQRTLERQVIVSQDGKSIRTNVEVPADERVRVGEEFIVETPEAIMQVRITDLQVGPDTRTNAATAEDVETFWTREVDNVSVNLTLHPRDGTSDETRSVTLHVPGDFEITIGETIELQEETLTVTDIHVRETALDRYPFKKLGQDGDTVEAKDVKRIYGYDETTKTPYSGW